MQSWYNLERAFPHQFWGKGLDWDRLINPLFLTFSALRRDRLRRWERFPVRFYRPVGQKDLNPKVPYLLYRSIIILSLMIMWAQQPYHPESENNQPQTLIGEMKLLIPIHSCRNLEEIFELFQMSVLKDERM